MAKQNEVEKKSLENTLVDNLKKKLRDDIAGMIPDEALDEMILTEVKRFEGTELPKIIKKELEQLFNERVKKLANKVMGDYCDKKWDKDTITKMKSELEKYVEASMFSMLQATITMPLQNAMSQIAQGMGRTCNNCNTQIFFQGQGQCPSCNNYIY